MKTIDISAIRKPSFTSSVMSGIAGSIKGFLAGGITGSLIGSVSASIIGLIVAGTTGVPTAAVMGAVLLGGTMATIGTIAGTFTGVVQSREKAQISEQDVTNLANKAFAQGMSVGHEMAECKAKHSYRERIMHEREVTSAQHRIH